MGYGKRGSLQCTNRPSCRPRRGRQNSLVAIIRQYKSPGMRLLPVAVLERQYFSTTISFPSLQGQVCSLRYKLIILQASVECCVEEILEATTRVSSKASYVHAAMSLFIGTFHRDRCGLNRNVSAVICCSRVETILGGLVWGVL